MSYRQTLTSLLSLLLHWWNSNTKSDAQLLPPYCLKLKAGDNDDLTYEAQMKNLQIFHKMSQCIDKMEKIHFGKNNKLAYAQWEKCMVQKEV